jgi:hypothetical protein
VGISVVFGVFSMIMAILSYWERAKRTEPSAVTPSASNGSAREPGVRGRLRGDHRR